MPKVTIPLILPSTARGWAASIGTSAKDQQLINGLYQVSRNSAAGSKAVYAQKRPGSVTVATLGASLVVLKDYSGDFSNLSIAGSGAARALVDLSTTYGVIGSLPQGGTNYVIASAIIGGKTVVAFEASGGWFLYDDAADSLTFSGDRTSGSPNLTNVASIAGIYPGQALSGTGIPADTRVSSASGSTVVMTNNATSGAGTTTTVTKEAVSKIIDAQFPSLANSMDAMDGYFFAGTNDGNIYQSAINDPSSWTSSDVIAADYEGDGISFIFKWQNYIVAAGSQGTIQYFYNAGNANGSVLSTNESLNVQGLILLCRPVVLGGVGYCVARPSTDRTGQTSEGLYALTGINNYQRISDDYWSSVISDNSLSTVNTGAIGNKPVIILTNSSVSVLYDPLSEQFSILDAGNVLTGFGEIFSKNGSSSLFSWSGGNVWTDSTVAYTFTAQTEPKTLNKGAPFIIRSVDLIADTEASGTATLYVSRDDYANWESVGTFDMTAQRKRIHALGWFHSNAAFKVEHSANTNFRAQAMIVDVEPCR